MKARRGRASTFRWTFSGRCQGDCRIEIEITQLYCFRTLNITIHSFPSPFYRIEELTTRVEYQFGFWEGVGAFIVLDHVQKGQLSESETKLKFEFGWRSVASRSVFRNGTWYGTAGLGMALGMGLKFQLQPMIPGNFETRESDSGLNFQILGLKNQESNFKIFQILRLGLKNQDSNF